MNSLQPSGLRIHEVTLCRAGCGSVAEFGGYCLKCSEEDAALERQFAESQQRKAARRAYREALALAEEEEARQDAEAAVANVPVRKPWKVWQMLGTAAVILLWFYILLQVLPVFLDWFLDGGSPWLS